MAEMRLVRLLASRCSSMKSALSVVPNRSNHSFVSRSKLLLELQEKKELYMEYKTRGRYVIYHKGDPLIQRKDEGHQLIWATNQELSSIISGCEEHASQNTVLLGVSEDLVPQFAILLPQELYPKTLHIENTFSAKFMNLRMGLFLLTTQDAMVASKGSAYLFWLHNHRNCVKCGSLVGRDIWSPHKKCGSCGNVHYPHTSPAVITLVTNKSDDKCLLVHQGRFPQGMYTTIAGYVDIGETLEEAVRREVAEEVGLEVQDLKYLFSHHWPYPTSTLMLACKAVVKPGEILLDKNELDDAQWFTVPEVYDGLQTIMKNPMLRMSNKSDVGVRWVPPKGTAAHELLQDWVAKHSVA